MTEAEVNERLARYGANELAEEERASKLMLFLNQLKNPLIGVLIVAALISLFVGHGIDAIVIAVVIIINTGIGFFRNSKLKLRSRL